MSPTRKLIIGSRSSPLALKQVDEVLMLLSQKGIRLESDCKTYSTQGDKDKTTPLTSGPADDFFTDTLDRALLNNEIDAAIHSAKDLPRSMLEGLEIFAITASLDETDAFVGRTKLSLLKPGARVGTSSLLRREAIRKLNPDIETVEIRGTIEERLAQFYQGKFDGIIVATCALKRLGLAKLIIEILPWEATALQGQLAVVGRRDDHEWKEVFTAIDVRKKYRKVFLVGAGPGDPDLITVKAIKTLKEAECVFYDYLVDKKLLEYAPGGSEKIFVGKRKGDRTLPQEELSRMLRQKAIEGKNVVRLKSGDPLIFGRGADEIAYLRSYHIEVEIIPGISSATGIPSQMGIPLTARGISSSVAFVSGHGEDEKSTEPQLVNIPKVDTIVFLMGLTKLNLIVRSLTGAGWKNDTPVVVISKGTRVDEKIVSGTIETIEKNVAAQQIEPPALIVVGEVVKFARHFSVTVQQKRALIDENILYVGTNPEKYQALGHIIHLPMIDIVKIEFPPETVQALLRDLPGYEIILFTSRFAVKYFFELLEEQKFPLSKIESRDFAVIGQDTAAALAEFHIHPKISASIQTSEGLLTVLEQHYDLKGKKILFPRSALANPFLKEKLTQLGSQVTELTVYQNLPGEKKTLEFEQINKVLFTSPSTVRNFLANYGTIPPNWQILSKGPHTSQALKEAGYESEVVVYS